MPKTYIVKLSHGSRDDLIIRHVVTVEAAPHGVMFSDKDGSCLAYFPTEVFLYAIESKQNPVP
jgi:hypothetical protein